MNKGLTHTEGILIQFTFSTLFLIGAYAVSRVSVPLAVYTLAAVLILWYYLHRIRVCAGEKTKPCCESRKYYSKAYP